mmetsp:Transcript_21633/g.32213  ORF Transcript_21633/g.32213 Transcript_21633/m.32213 type:complete len:111 (-) Transcript_21633:964-1296(-)
MESIHPIYLSSRAHLPASTKYCFLCRKSIPKRILKGVTLSRVNEAAVTILRPSDNPLQSIEVRQGTLHRLAGCRLVLELVDTVTGPDEFGYVKTRLKCSKELQDRNRQVD